MHDNVVLKPDTVKTVTDYANYNAVGATQSTLFKRVPYTQAMVEPVLRVLYRDVLANGQRYCYNTAENIVKTVAARVQQSESLVRVVLQNWFFANQNGVITDFPKYNCSSSSSAATPAIDVSGADYVSPCDGAWELFGKCVQPAVVLGVSGGVIVGGTAIAWWLRTHSYKRKS